LSDTSPPRYGVYYAPPGDGALWPLAQSWLGRDCESGQRLPQPTFDGWRSEELAEATESPRRYGFHATLKAPFRLAPDSSEQDLYESLAVFAQRQRPFAIPPLKVSAIGAFIALTLSAPAPEMSALAAAAVNDLDPLRAALSESDIQRRLAAGLTPRQEELLRTWGYPYVFEEFRFHMTLTGPIGRSDRRERLQTSLAAHFRPVLADPVPVEEICLYSQPAGDAPFRLVERFRLGEAAAGSASN
jgi:putative phosphonate metabolism protein